MNRKKIINDKLFLEILTTKSFPLLQDNNKIHSRGKKWNIEKISLERALAEEKKQAQQRIATLSAEKTSLESALAKEKKQGQQRIATLSAEKMSLERKLRDRLKKVTKIALVIGAPILAIISPFIFLILLKKHFEKIHPKLHIFKKNEALISNFAAIVESSTEKNEFFNQSPKQLNKLYSNLYMNQLGRKKPGPLASIIIPSFNNEDFLAQSIHSVLMQSHYNLEVIIVDDGSTDRSISIALEIAKADNRVKVIPLLRNFGCYYARNIGLMHSKGEYIGICDSDDMLSPDFLEKSLDTINQNSSLIACQSRVRRWSKDFSAPISSLRYGEITLLWRRSAIHDIGWYDTTRFASDTEFRSRLIAFYGKSALMSIPDETYYARSVEDSLTLTNESRAHELKDGRLQSNLSLGRQRYSGNFKSWHENFESEQALKFPLLKRPFELGDVRQNASPSLGQRCIGAMASSPERIASLRTALPSILNQFDLIYLYLNKYESIPDFCIHPKIAVTLSTKGVGDLCDSGKFYSLPFSEESYIFTLDDNIIYPEDYTQKMIHYIEVFSRKTVVGVHGINFPKGSFSDFKQTEVFNFMKQNYGGFVDLLGTGTIAWHNSILQPTLNDFKTKDVCDVWFARLAALSEVSLFSVPREENWLRSINGNQSYLVDETTAGQTSFFEVYEKFYAPILKEKQLRQKSIDDLKRNHSDLVVNALFGEFWLGDRGALLHKSYEGFIS
jgi:glycosyltransferase involved in cell wall biosynthesis